MKKRSVRFAYALVALGALLVAGGLTLEEPLKRHFFGPTNSSIDQGVIREENKATKVIAGGLAVPWEIAFLPGGDMFVTERPGTLKRIGQNGQSFRIEGVEHIGEGGLLGVALHPDFARNNWVYLYLTAKGGSGLVNRVERYVYANDILSQKKLIIGDIPGAANHDGGRIAFGPDKKLYITTGDAGDEKLAQDTNSLAGKILRLNDDGSVPEDNPFDNAVYSYGHRNSQGMAWDEQGRLWATEHGRSGIKSGYDELNLIEPGANYGWPLIQGDETMEGMKNPVVHSGPDETWAPAGMAYYDGSLYFAGLRGESLYKATINPNGGVTLKSYLREAYGRLRSVVLGPDKMFYISTSNTDGRGEPEPDDDKIIRLSVEVFER